MTGEPTDAWKEFLESTPAYIERRFENLLREHPTARDRSLCLPSPRIQLHCEVDDGVRWFQPFTEYVFLSNSRSFVAYQCRDCGRSTKIFAISMSVDPKEDPPVLTALKLGEWLPFGSHVAQRLQKMLSKDDLELYRKGLRCEREGHGIGAAAYYRRVVENQWRELVTKLRDAAQKIGASNEQLALFDAALKETQFSSAVEKLKDAIPGKLLILDGQNPLTLLYTPLSQQIHGLDDAACLQQAADIRVVLNELFDNIASALQDHEELRAAAGRLNVKP